MQEETMRDIRNDLQERAKLIEDEISGTTAHFEIKRREHDARIGQLKSELAVLGILMESEQQRMASEPPTQREYQRTPDDLAPVQSELRHIGDRIRQLQNGRTAPNDSLDVAERPAREPNERRGGY
jgi:hypothetical protein